MSTYTPRRGPNMNQYIASLNPLPGSTEPTPTEGSFPNLDDELSLFTNVEFLNEFDLGDTVEGQGVNGSEDGFNFHYLPSDVTGLPGYSGARSTPTATEFVAPYGAPTYTPQHPGATPQVDSSKLPGTTTNASSPTDGLESGSRVAAEEDKRRRNTAASARFRVKKKQREQALERTAKDMTDRAEKLEARITELEQENKFLRSLVVEKAGGATKEEEGVSDVLRKVAADARKADSSKKGVGTEA